MFETKITEGSREYKGRDKLFMSDVTDATSINAAAEDAKNEGGRISFGVKDYAVVQVHNDQSKENKDYTNYVFVDNDGHKWYTGSKSFFEAFKRILDAMEGDPFEIAVNLIPSSNYAGRNILSCSIV